ncbi:nitroreductase family protein [Sphingomonas profundi]|uniref:nitroreductase family protein n=1 Tax=Alterirhizorhabdus profundi TaxID=2681549 RepID=UPI0012E79A1D|nr:nitroreductase family protein [Sphingomonas profundi]
MSDRSTDTALDPLFLSRWSPRAFDGSAMPEADLRTILDAARWAPSAYNYQPWTLLYARRDDANWERFLGGLVPFNRSWAKDSAMLIYIVSDTLMFGDDPAKAAPSHSHSFDAGAAWAQLALQATMLGYHSHGMVGVDFDAVRTELGVPDRYRIEAAVAIGTRGDPSSLPEGLREREVPSLRKPIEQIAFAGNFPS